MKRLGWVLVLVAFMLPILVIGCSMEKDEDDWVDELRDRRTRDNALMWVQEHKTKKAVPNLLSLMKKRYGTLKAVYTLGIIGDPVAVPTLIEELKVVAKKDSLDHDRLTEQICMALGMIGETNAVDALLWTVDQAGEMGRAGAVQALGMIGDPRATEKLIGVLKNTKEKLLIRHYTAIALGRLKASEAADALVYALFVDDETGRNLFRDGQLSLLQIGGEAARKALIAGYELKNTDANELAKSIDLKEDWIKIKIVNVMGELRDPELSDFFMAEFEKGLKGDIVYELQAKIIQAMERTPLKKDLLGKLAQAFTSPVKNTAYLNERELISKIFISNNYTDQLDEFMSVAEKGDVTLKNAKGKPQAFSQWCVAAANVVSMLGDHTLADRFDAFVKAGKCKAEIFGLKQKTPELLANFNMRMQAAKECGTNMACWQKVVTAKEWPKREKAVYMLAATGDKKYMTDVMKTLTYSNEQVRQAVQHAIWKIATPEVLPQLIKFWIDNKINKDFQKITEDIGYILHMHIRDWNLDGPKAYKELFEKAEKLRGKTASVDVPMHGEEELSTDSGL